MLARQETDRCEAVTKILKMYQLGHSEKYVYICIILIYCRAYLVLKHHALI